MRVDSLITYVLPSSVVTIFRRELWIEVIIGSERQNSYLSAIQFVSMFLQQNYQTLDLRPTESQSVGIGSNLMKAWIYCKLIEGLSQFSQSLHREIYRPNGETEKQFVNHMRYDC